MGFTVGECMSKVNRQYYAGVVTYGSESLPISLSINAHVCVFSLALYKLDLLFYFFVIIICFVCVPLLPQA